MSEIKEISTTTSLNSSLSNNLTEEQKVQEIEQILRKTLVKSKTLIDDAFKYMALLINEDCPKNGKELEGLIGDFLSDGLAYREGQESFKLC